MIETDEEFQRFLREAEAKAGKQWGGSAHETAIRGAATRRARGDWDGSRTPRRRNYARWRPQLRKTRVQRPK